MMVFSNLLSICKNITIIKRIYFHDFKTHKFSLPEYWLG